MNKRSGPSAKTTSSEKLRLNQAIAKTGLCARRKADQLIAEGKVKVNGLVCREFNQLVDTRKDRLEVDGRRLDFKQLAYVLMNKPKGIVTTASDEQGRQAVVDLLPEELRHLKPVGRLDMYSEGLLLLTNDGDLAQKLTHPKFHLPKTYSIRVKGSMTNNHLAQLSKGIPLEDGMSVPTSVRLLSRNKTYTELEIVLVEGRNRQLRRMFDYLEYRVARLVRRSIGALQLGQMAPGTWRHLTSRELSALLSQSTK